MTFPKEPSDFNLGGAPDAPKVEGATTPSGVENLQNLQQLNLAKFRKFEASRKGKLFLPGPYEPYPGVFQSPQAWFEKQVASMAEVSMPDFLPVNTERDEYHLPVAWSQNWQDQVLGPRGEGLPKGAFSWDRFGEPYFGEPGDFGLFGDFKNWIKKAWWEVTKPTEDAPPFTAFGKDWEARLREATEGQVVGPGQALTSIKPFLEVVLPEIKELLIEMGNRARNPEIAEGPVRTIGAIAGRSAGEFIKGIGDLVNLFPQAFEKITGLALVPAAVLADRSSLAPLGDEGWDKFFKNANFFIFAPGRIYQIARAAEAVLSGRWTPKETIGIITDIDANLQAARIAYSLISHEGLAADYIRRMEEGADPRLLALELEDPVAEMWGQILNDPLLLYGMLGKGKKAVAALDIADAKLAGDTPIMELLAQSPTTSTKGILDHLDEIAAATGRLYEDTRLGTIELGARRRPLELIASAKQSVYGREAQDVLGVLAAHHYGDGDKLFDTLEALARLASDDISVRKEAWLALSKSGLPVSYLTSQPVTRTAIVLRDLLFDSGGRLTSGLADDIARVAGNPDELIEIWSKKIDNIYKDKFPNVQQQVAQGKRYAELLADDAEKAAEFLRKNPIADQAISPGMLRAADFHQAMTKWVFKPMHGAQGVLYMVLSPAYWARNRLSNAFHVFVDSGIKPGLRALRYGPGKALEEIRMMTGGWSPTGARMAFGGPASEATGFFPSLKRGFLGKAARDEAAAGQVIQAHSIRKTMLNALQEGRAIPDLSAIRGMTGDEAAYFVGLVRDNFGDVDKSITEFFSFRGQARRHMGFLSPEDQNILRDHRMYDDVMETYRSSSTPDELASKMDDLKAEYDELADLSAGEAASLDTANMTVQEANTYTKDIEAIRANIGDQAADLITRRINTNRAFRKASSKALREIEIMAHRLDQDADALRALSDPDFALRQRMFSTEEIPGQAADIGYTRLKTRYSEQTEGLETLWDGIYKRADDFRDSRWDLTRRSGKSDVNFRELWREAGLEGTPPRGLGKEEFNRALWDNYRTKREFMFTDVRDRQWQIENALIDTLEEFVPGLNTNTTLRNRASALYDRSRMLDNAFIDSQGRAWVLRRFPGAATASEDEIRLIEKLLARERMTLQEAELADLALKRGALPEEAARLEEIKLVEDQADVGVIVSEAEQLARKAEKDAIFENILERMRVGPDELIPAAELDEALKTRKVVDGIPEGAEPIPAAETSGITPTGPRVAEETRGGLWKWVDETLKPQLEENFNSVPVSAESSVLESDLRAWGVEAKSRVTQARATSIEIANEARKFTLHDYGERFGIDLAAMYIYPYQFWHSRTYLKWFKRIMSDPALFSVYSTYRTQMEKFHAGLPDWWKFHLNTNELLGIESDNPFYFQLEATISPLHALTGADYNDKYKRVDTISSGLDDLNKFGPGTWTIFSLALATYYHFKGKEEASARWAGRITTGTRAFRDLTALLGVREGRGLEIDPFINAFSGGIGPYERPRVALALGDMLDEGYSEEELIDAGNQQSGPLWEEAVARMVQARAAGNMFGFVAGVGFKPRSQTDIQIDQMYNDMYATIRNRENFSEQEYQDRWEKLRQAYPFLDVVLLSRKGGLERDEAFAWNVLRRIPPSMNREFAGLVGMQEDAISRFYESKGDLTLLTESERLDFMAGIIDLGAILEIPSGTTRQEWQRARTAYSVMREEGEERFGDDIWDRIDVYFGAKGDTQLEKDRAEAILKADPLIGEALDFQSLFIGNNPFLSPYYNGLNKIEGYFKGQMYKVIEEELGPEIWDMWSIYWSLKAAGGDFKQYWKDNPELERYGEMKDDMLAGIEEHFEQFKGLFPEALPATTRPVEPATAGQQAIFDALNQQQLQISPQEWQQLLGLPLYQLALSNFDLPESAINKLKEIGEELGLSVNEILEQLTMSTVLQ